MKDAVHKLRNQLRRKTKKPSTISVLKAAKQEIDVSQHGSYTVDDFQTSFLPSLGRKLPGVTNQPVEIGKFVGNF